MTKRRAWLLCTTLAGCSGGGTAKVTIVPNVVAGTQQGSAGSTSVSGLGESGSAIRIGSATAMTLQSLKYYITSIQICQSVDNQGSGYSNPIGCLNLFDAQADGYDTYQVAEAEADTAPGHFIDLMSAEGQAQLHHPVSLDVHLSDPHASADASSAGSYTVGLINFFRPIKVTAQFPIVGDTSNYFRTRAVTKIDVGPTDMNGHTSNTVEIGDTLSGPTEETTYMLNNGGALFTFQKPFEVTQADVDAGNEIKMDLVFNPENFGQAYETQSCLGGQFPGAICDPINNVAIDMPYVRMNPVPRKSGDKTHKETYLMDYDTHVKLRIELYYNDADAEAGVQGVDAAVVYDATANSTNLMQSSNNIIASNFTSQTGSVTTNDATVSLEDYQHTPTLSGLVRRQSGTATVHCVFTGSVCPTAGGTQDKAYTFVGDTIVSAD